MQPIIRLTPPRISPYHIKEKIVCIRAHRERIFNVSAHTQGTQLICHNYGHGGAGWTFLFGSVNESIRLFEQQYAQNNQLRTAPITVVGAGCIGLLTALCLAYKGYKVHILADTTDDIPSHKAAGFFFPRPRKCSKPDERIVFEQLGMESYATYLSIINGTHPFITHGPLLMPAYFGLDIDPGFGPYIEKGLVATPERVTIDFGNGKMYETMRYYTVFINTGIIMQELYRNIHALNIPIIQHTVHNLNDIQTPVVFNCAGLGAKQLTGDARIVPVQGHLLTLTHQPPMDQLQYMVNVKVTQYNAHGKPRDELIYYAPKDDGIVGITFIRGQDNPHTNHHEFDRLIERCQTFFGTDY
jgi:D-amino-acid oxidase